MAGYRYSLAQVSVGITFPHQTTAHRFGGQGEMIGSITVSRKNDRFSAEGDATGGFVVNESLDKTGTLTISIKQFAPLVSTLTNLFNMYDDGFSYDAVEVSGNTEEEEIAIDTLSMEDTMRDTTSIDLYYMGKLIVSCKGCYLNMPELPLEEENGTRDFTFECGEINFSMLDNSKAVATYIPQNTNNTNA